MKKLMSKLVAFALVATLAFALTGCFVTPNSAITFNKYPEATYEVGTSENSALSSIVVTLTENGTKVKEGNLADLEKEGVIVVEGFELATEGANKTAKIIFGTAVVSFNYSVVAKATSITDLTTLKAAFASSAEKLVARLDADIAMASEEDFVILTAKHLVLDLNGHKISSTSNTGNKRMITVNEGTTLEVKDSDSKKTGTIVNEVGKGRGIFEVVGELVIHSGKYVDYGTCTNGTSHTFGHGATLNVEGGSATIYNGEFKHLKDVERIPENHKNNNFGRSVLYINSGSLKVYDGVFYSEADPGYGSYLIQSNDKLFIYGGNFECFRGVVGCNAGSFDIRGGVFKQTSTASSGHTLYFAGVWGALEGTISGGEFTAVKGDVLCVGDLSDEYGGEKANVGVVITAGKFTALEQASIVSLANNGNANAACSLKGGLFNKQLTSAQVSYLVAEGYALITEAVNGYYEVKAI